MKTKVAIVPIAAGYQQALHQAIDLVGGIETLNTAAREVTIKVGVFDPRQQHHASLEAVRSIVTAFDQSPHIYLAESDNYCGKSLDRLERFSALYDQRVTPQSLSADPCTKMCIIADEA